MDYSLYLIWVSSSFAYFNRSVWVWSKVIRLSGTYCIFFSLSTQMFQQCGIHQNWHLILALKKKKLSLMFDSTFMNKENIYLIQSKLLLLTILLADDRWRMFFDTKEHNVIFDLLIDKWTSLQLLFDQESEKNLRRMLLLSKTRKQWFVVFQLF
jgi:hypothetical protein